jgi:hypothetical protein
MYVADTSDDMGLVVPRRYLNDLKEVIGLAATHFGFSFEVEQVSDDYRRFYWMQSFLLHDAGVKTRYIRDIRRTLSRAFVTDKPIHLQAVRLAWFSAVGIGGLVECGDVPILRAVYRMFLVWGQGYLPMALETWDSENGQQVNALIAELRLADKKDSRCQRERRNERLQRFLAYYRQPSSDLLLAVVELQGFASAEIAALENYYLNLALDEGVTELIEYSDALVHQI